MGSADAVQDTPANASATANDRFDIEIVILRTPLLALLPDAAALAAVDATCRLGRD
jgi:hypothetical protein